MFGGELKVKNQKQVEGVADIFYYEYFDLWWNFIGDAQLNEVSLACLLHTNNRKLLITFIT